MKRKGRRVALATGILAAGTALALALCSKDIHWIFNIKRIRTQVPYILAYGKRNGGIFKLNTTEPAVRFKIAVFVENVVRRQ